MIPTELIGTARVPGVGAEMKCYRHDKDFKIFVDPDMPLPSSIFSRENEKAARKTVRALRTRVFEGPQGSS